MSEYENYLKFDHKQNTVFRGQFSLDTKTVGFLFPVQFGTQL